MDFGRGKYKRLKSELQYRDILYTLNKTYQVLGRRKHIYSYKPPGKYKSPKLLIPFENKCIS